MMMEGERTAETAWYGLRVDRRGLSLRNLEGQQARRPVPLAGPQRAPALGFPVEEILKRRGYKPFIPVESIFIRRDRFRPKEKRRVKRALLPGMLFLNLPTRGVNWYSLLTAPMVHGVFGVGGAPYRFSEAGIERLIAISADLRQPDFYRPMPTRRGYEVGDEVVDMTGLFEDRLKVVEIEGETAKVLAPFFGEVREIRMQAAQLAKAAE